MKQQDIIKADVVIRIRIAKQGYNILRNQRPQYYAVIAEFVGMKIKGKDHVNIFPSDWENADLAQDVARGLFATGTKHTLRGDLYVYTRVDGTKSFGFKNLRKT